MSRARTIDVVRARLICCGSVRSPISSCAAAARGRPVYCEIPSMRRSSSSLNEVFLSAPMLSISCCGRDAPTSTEATMPSCSSQASDISASVCPRPAATSWRALICCRRFSVKSAADRNARIHARRYDGYRKRTFALAGDSTMTIFAIATRSAAGIVRHVRFCCPPERRSDTGWSTVPGRAGRK